MAKRAALDDSGRIVIASAAPPTLRAEDATASLLSERFAGKV